MKILILVDLQNDFVAPGALPVPHGNEVVEIANRISHHFDVVIATQDWHPADHQSFASQHPGLSIGSTFELNGLPQVAWPDHCIQGTHGADFLASLDLRPIHRVFRKGMNRQIDSYSGFYDNGHLQPTGLGEYLQDIGATAVYVMGLATDYCVRFTALDSIGMGFATYLILDGCRGVNLQPGDVDRAVEEMRKAGVILLQSQDCVVDSSERSML